MRAPGWTEYVDTCVGAPFLSDYRKIEEFGKFKRNTACASSAELSFAPHRLDLVAAPLEIGP